MKIHSFRKIWKAYWRAAQEVRKLIPTQLFLLVGDAVIQSMVPAALAFIIGRVESDSARFIQNEILPVLIAILGGGMLFCVVAYAQHYLSEKISRMAAVRFQTDLYAHLQCLSADFYLRTKVGEITSRLTNDVNTGVFPFYRRVTNLMWTVAVLVPASITMLFLDARLFMVFAATVAVFTALMSWFVPRMRSLQREVSDEMGRVNARLTEDMSAMSLTRSFAREDETQYAVEEHCRLYLNKSLRAARYACALSDILQSLLKIVAPLFIVVMGVYINRGKVSAAILVAFFGYWKAAAEPVARILMQTNEFFASFASFDRVLEFFDETPLIKDDFDAEELSISGDVELRNISFRYPVEDGDIVLSNLNLVIPRGNSLALVGGSGAGKSTIAQLMMRFYDPVEGQVLIDGHDVKKIRQQSLRRQIGFVAQEAVLMSGTVRENMLFAKPDASDEEIVQALKNADAWGFVGDMNEGLNTLLGERGTRLSGGQKQRLSIARVFLKDPPIVIFDEATSALDTITEKQIQGVMRDILKNRTSMIIAHRISTIVDCDLIVVLEGGRVLDRGTHSELLGRCERYRELCAKQQL